MATTTQHNDARNDPELLRRAIGKLEQLGVANAQMLVEQNMAVSWPRLSRRVRR